MDVGIFGPQRAGDSKLLRRVRAHQSWYRYEILGLESWGLTAPPNQSPYGSILDDRAAAAGANFTSSAAREAYIRRRQLGWGVEPYRCERYLTSSQVLTINLLAPLAAELGWLNDVLTVIGLGATGLASGLDIEYQPSHRLSGRLDRTLADAFVDTAAGGIVIETKLADQFSKRWRSAAQNPFYEEVNEKFALWPTARSTFDTTARDQMARVHALGTLTAGTPCRVLFIHHPLDVVGATQAERYRDVLADPSLLHVIDLSKFLAALVETASSALQRQIASQLQVRYVAHELSDEAFGVLERARRSRRPAAVTIR